MNMQWTLHVEDFGKIKQADIEVSKLMMFVGDNNSGKSYIMSLLWGLLTCGRSIFPITPPKSSGFEKCVKWIDCHYNEEVKLQTEDMNVFIDWFNELLSSKKNDFVRKIFNHEITIGEIKIINYKRSKPFLLNWHQESPSFSDTKEATIISFLPKEKFTRRDYLNIIIYICWVILFRGMGCTIPPSFLRDRRVLAPVYFPASRTGFMLTYPQLVDASLTNTFGVAEYDGHLYQSALTMPYLDFLSLILKFEESKQRISKYDRLIDFIQSHLIDGEIVVKKELVPTFKYKAQDSETELPLYVVSSVVSEISPLLLLFKSNLRFNTIIIEEPEAHLHPKLQLQIARLIIRMMNEGFNVWITTHSDTIIQHVNNMINLNKHPDKSNLMEQYGYERNDLLNPDDVSMYQFDKCEDNKACISVLKRSEYGFVVPTFNDMLDNLTNEILDFQGNIED